MWGLICDYQQWEHMPMVLETFSVPTTEAMWEVVDEQMIRASVCVCLAPTKGKKSAMSYSDRALLREYARATEMYQHKSELTAAQGVKRCPVRSPASRRVQKRFP